MSGTNAIIINRLNAKSSAHSLSGSSVSLLTIMICNPIMRIDPFDKVSIILR